MAETELPKVVAPRNDFKPQPVFVKASIADQAGARPGYRRQWMHAKDPLHPQYFQKYLDRQSVGSSEIGYCTADGWTVVERKDAKLGRRRDDDSVGVDSAQMHGDLVLMETPEDNANIYDMANKLKIQARERALGHGEKEHYTADNGGRAHYQARMGKGNVADDPRVVLKQGER